MGNPNFKVKRRFIHYTIRRSHYQELSHVLDQSTIENSISNLTSFPSVFIFFFFFFIAVFIVQKGLFQIGGIFVYI